MQFFEWRAREKKGGKYIVGYFTNPLPVYAEMLPSVKLYREESEQ
jgi:hypothetical protein